MNDRFSVARGRTDELGRDLVIAEALEELDPASRDPNYWFRFRGWVMADAARELARRRLMAELTVGDVLTSWGRAVVPTALLAAALAGIALLRAGEVPVGEPLGVEVLMVEENLPQRGAFTFASDEF